MYHNKMEHHAASLTKENFWKDLHAKYPAGVEAFHDWVDEYKKAVDWNSLFKKELHYLPAAVQEGIWWAFVRDRGGCGYEIDDMFSINISEHITEMVKMLEGEAKI